MTKARYPLEYVAVTCLALSTDEGPAYLFMGVDAYSEYILDTYVTKDGSNQAFYTFLWKLFENPQFVEKNTHGFTLVLEVQPLEIVEEVRSICAINKGTVLVDAAYSEEILKPVLESLKGEMGGGALR